MSVTYIVYCVASHACKSATQPRTDLNAHRLLHNENVNCKIRASTADHCLSDPLTLPCLTSLLTTIIVSRLTVATNHAGTYFLAGKVFQLLDGTDDNDLFHVL